MDIAPVLELREIAKTFPGVRALKGVGFDLYPGEVLAVLGENGAGKSTLMKILAGVQKEDVGEIKVDGSVVDIRNVSDALKLGIVLIHQELNLSDNLDISSNIFLGRELTRYGVLCKSQMHQQSQEYLNRVGLNINPRTPVNKLQIGQQQLVEIAKALSNQARILIMDEPTSSLSHIETQKLFTVIKVLKAAGVSIIYITHKLSEVEELADRSVVLRDGEVVGELQKSQLKRNNMIPMMVGRDISKIYMRHPHQSGNVVLELSNFKSHASPQHPVNFKLHAGEVVGIFGLVGAGRTELLESIFGVNPAASGAILVDGVKRKITHPDQAVTHGIALVPEDRKQHGLILEMSVAHNSSLPSIRKTASGGIFINHRKEKILTEESIEKLAIKTPRQNQITKLLSGGNQQKIVIGKWLAMSPRVLMLDEPTRGIDVGAKLEIYQLIDKLASQGMAILFVSSEMDEVIGLSDRVLVMHEGKMAGELFKEQINELNILKLATGQQI